MLCFHPLRTRVGELVSASLVVFSLTIATVATARAFGVDNPLLYWGTALPYRTVCYYVTPGATSRWGWSIQSAASTWSNAGAKFRFLRYQDIDDCDEENYVNKKNHTPLDPNGTPAPAFTTYEAHSIGGGPWFLTRARTWLNSGDYQWSNDGSPPQGCGTCQWYDAETVLLHEFGHWLRLIDIDTSTPIIGPHPLSHVQHSLDSDDVNGIKAVYGSN